ncbi:MAG TPA: hypothetical protein VHN37_02205 [Actinomycetota bacterium]|nr:hypothetical protein [Actinomycetota bacterium]
MPEMVGTVQCVRVGPDSGFTTIQEQGTGETETFIVWWPGVTTSAEPSVSERVIHTMWISFLRQAMADNLLVRVGHPTNSGKVNYLQLGT